MNDSTPIHPAPVAEVEIRRVLPGDAALFGNLADEVFDMVPDPHKVAAYLAAPGHCMFVALHDGVVVGQTAAVVHRHPDKPTELYVDEVGVAPDFQRRGIAGRMLDAMLAHGKAIGCEEAWVGTEPDNLPAKGLYERRLRHGDDGAEAFVMYVFRL